MIADTDLIGIISTSVIMGLLLVGLTVLVAIKCYTRLERRKQDQIRKIAVERQRDSEAFRHVNSRGNLSNASIMPPDMMSNYRPKIFHGIEDITLDQYLAKERRNEREATDHRTDKPRQTNKQNGGLNMGKAVSVINVSSNNVNSHGGQVNNEVRTHGQITEGFIRAPSSAQQHERQDIVQGHIVQEVARKTENEIHPLNERNLRIEPVIVQISGNKGMIHGHIIKQNVSLGYDGKLVITSSEERDARDFEMGRNRQKNDVLPFVPEHVMDTEITELQDIRIDEIPSFVIQHAVNTDITEVQERRRNKIQSSVHPLSVNKNITDLQGEKINEIQSFVAQQGTHIVESHTTLESVALEDKIANISIHLEQEEDAGSVRSETGMLSVSTTDFENNRPAIATKNVYSNEESHSSWYISQNAQASKRREVQVLSARSDNWVLDSDGEDERPEDSYGRSRAAVVNQADDATTDSDSSSHMKKSQSVIKTTVKGEHGKGRRHDDSMSQFYSDSMNYKVIKKHSAHKPPDWLVRTYAESAASEEQLDLTQAVQKVEKALATSSPRSFRKGAQKVSFADLVSLNQEQKTLSGEENYPEPDYVNSSETHHLTDLADPDSGIVGRAVARINKSLQENEDGAVTTTSLTATAMRELRQSSNGAQQRSSQMLLSVPVALWETSQVEEETAESSVQAHER